MIERKELIRFANHVTAVTEPLRGKSGAINFSKRALKSAQALMTAANEIGSGDAKVQKRALDSALSEYHRLEYVLDGLLAAQFISDADHARISSEGVELRKALIISIGEARGAK